MAPDVALSTREKLLEAGEAVMLERGYVAATVDAICKAAGVTKGSFFHYFSSKEELGKALIEVFSTRQGAQFAEACGHLTDPLDRVYCLIDGAIHGADRPEMKGCLIGTLAQEISETHPELRKVCESCFEGFAAALEQDLKAAKANECPDADFDTAGLARHFLSVAQGSMLLFRATGDRSVMKESFAHFRSYLRSLYGR